MLSSPVRWIRPKLGLFDMSSLKSEARREPFKVTAPSRKAVCYLETNSKCGDENLIYRCQFRGAFIAPLPTDKYNILDLKCSLRHLKPIANLFERRCQQLYVVYKRPQTELCAPLAICFQIANGCTRCRCSFQGFSQDGERVDFSENLRVSLFDKDCLFP